MCGKQKGEKVKLKLVKWKCIKQENDMIVKECRNKDKNDKANRNNIYKR